MKRTFGPAVIFVDDGSFRAVCTWCTFRIHNTCTHVRPVRRLDDPENTPEWCEMREGMIRDAKKMHAAPPPPKRKRAGLAALRNRESET